MGISIIFSESKNKLNFCLLPKGNNSSLLNSIFFGINSGGRDFTLFPIITPSMPDKAPNNR